MSSGDVSVVFHQLATQDWPEQEVRKLQTKESSVWFSHRLYSYSMDPLGLNEIIARLYQLIRNRAYFCPGKSDVWVHNANKILIKLRQVCQVCSCSKERDLCLTVLRTLEHSITPHKSGVSIPVAQPQNFQDDKSEINKENFESQLKDACKKGNISRIGKCFEYLKKTANLPAHCVEREPSLVLSVYLHGLPSEKHMVSIDLLIASCLLGRKDYRDQCLAYLKANKLTHLLRTQGDFEIEIIGTNLEIMTARVFSAVISSLSPYFRGMVTSGMRESSLKRVTILEQPPLRFLELLDSIHKGPIKFNEEDVGELLRLSELYQDDKLKEKCEHVIKELYLRLCLSHEILKEGLEFSEFYHAYRLQEYLMHLGIKMILQEGKYEQGKSFNKAYADMFSKYGKRLKRLDFSESCFSDTFRGNRVDCKSMDFLISNLPNLTGINLSFCKDIDDATLENLIEGLSLLEALDISDCSKVTNYGLSKIAKISRPFLRSLNLSGCYEIARIGIERLCENMTQITALNVRKCPKIKDDAVARIAHCLTNLCSVSLGGLKCCITDFSLRQVATNLTKLQYLDISWCGEMTNSSLAVISTHQTNLKTLKIADCPLISSTGVANIATRLTQLEWLSLSHSMDIDNVALGAIEESLTNLKCLELDRCTRFTESGLQSLANHMYHLTSLNLMNCKNVTNKVFIAIGENTCQLEHLNLGMSDQLNDDTLRFMTARLKRLRWLNLQNCTQLTDNAVSAIIEADLPLQHLNLHECKKITSKAMEDLREKYPSLIRIRVREALP